jgi:hypothetical protein
MPENQQPPSWGPAYDERDLDALLSGETAGLPGALLPLAATLATLHDRPVHAELAGEAAARAAFRHFAQDAGSWAPGAEHGTVRSHTLVLSRPQADRPSRHAARHRRRRAGGGSRRPLAIVGTAAALLLVAGVALAGVLPGPMRHLSPFGRIPAGPSAVATGTAQVSPGPSVDATASREPTIRPTPASSGGTGATPTPGELCREYYAFYEHSEPKSAWAGELALWQKLDALAGGPWKVFSYCLPDVGFGSMGDKGMTVTPPRGSNPWSAGNAGNTGAGSGGSAGSGNAGQAGSGDTGQPGSGSGKQPGDGSVNGPGSGQPGQGHAGDKGGSTSGAFG